MKELVTKASIGLGAPGFGVVMSYSHVEESLRITSLAIGILVGIASFVSILLSIYRNRDK